MYFAVPSLVVISAFIQVSLACPFPDFEFCGSDGKTYKNICEWEIAKLTDRDLKAINLGPCQKHVLHDLYRSLLTKYRNNDNLAIQSRGSKDWRGSVRTDRDDIPQKPQRIEPVSVYFLRTQDDEQDDR